MNKGELFMRCLNIEIIIIIIFMKKQKRNLYLLGKYVNQIV